MKKRLFAFPLTVCILLCCILTALPAHATGTGGESAVSSARNGVVHTVEEIRELTGADSLGYLSLENLRKLAPDAQCGFCDQQACGGKQHCSLPAAG